jgi:hypothetical protein
MRSDSRCEEKAGRKPGSCFVVAVHYLIGFAPIGAECARIYRSLPRRPDNCHNLQALSCVQSLPEFQNTQYLLRFLSWNGCCQYIGHYSPQIIPPIIHG